MQMQNTINGLDELSGADFSLEEKSRAFLGELAEAIGWAVIMVGFALAMTYLTPPQRSAEADLFEARINGEVP